MIHWKKSIIEQINFFSHCSYKLYNMKDQDLKFSLKSDKNFYEKSYFFNKFKDIYIYVV